MMANMDQLPACNHIHFQGDSDTELTAFIYLEKYVSLCLV